MTAGAYPRPGQCVRCAAPLLHVLGAYVAGEPVEIALDARPREDGTVWIDAQGRARAVATFYPDGRPRYRPHSATCPTPTREMASVGVERD